MIHPSGFDSPINDFEESMRVKLEHDVEQLIKKNKPNSQTNEEVARALAVKPESNLVAPDEKHPKEYIELPYSLNQPVHDSEVLVAIENKPGQKKVIPITDLEATDNPTTIYLKSKSA